MHASQLTSSTSTASTTLSLKYHPTQDLRCEIHPSQQLDQRLQQLKLQHIAAIDEEPSKQVIFLTEAPPSGRIWN